MVKTRAIAWATALILSVAAASAPWPALAQDTGAAPTAPVEPPAAPALVPPAAPPAVVTEAPGLTTPAPDAAGEASGGAAGATLPAGDTAPAGDSTVTADAAEALPVSQDAAVPAPAHGDLMDIVLIAHPVVQAVMAVLALAAFLALTIMVQKIAEFAMAFARMRRAAQVLETAPGLAEAAAALAGEKGPAATMTRAAAEELRLTEADIALLPGTRQRSQDALARIEAGAAMRLRAGTGILASIGSIAPFVGLFGTVFGIMNSFLAIAETKTTNLAVVAPGIAEALLATAIGLAAAIPAVLIYNYLSRRLAAFRHRMTDLATLILALQSRALDRLAARPVGGANVKPLARAVVTGG